MRLVRWIVETLKNPREVSTILPSSNHLAERIASHVDFDEAEHIAELGAGDGALTQPLADGLKDETKLYLFEVSESFCDDLKENYANHPNIDSIEVLNRDATELPEFLDERGIDELDYVISGLPLSTLPDDVTEGVLENVVETLRLGGKYIQFQYSPHFKARIEEIFGNIHTEREWKNLWFVPTWVYVAKKTNHSTIENIR